MRSLKRSAIRIQQLFPDKRHILAELSSETIGFVIHSKQGVMHTCISARGSLCTVSLNPCARTVHEWIVFNLLELALSEKQIPRFVGNVGS